LVETNTYYSQTTFTMYIEDDTGYDKSKDPSVLTKLYDAARVIADYRNGEDINSFRKYNPLIERVHIANVPFKDICLTEYQVSLFRWGHVKEIIENYHPALSNASSVVLFQGHYICINGQHSAISHWLSGMDNVPCLVTEIDDFDWQDNEDIKYVKYMSEAKLLGFYDILINEYNVETMEDLREVIINEVADRGQE